MTTNENPGLCWFSQCEVPMLGIGPSRVQCREPGSKAELEAAEKVGSSYTAVGSRQQLVSGGEIPGKQSREAYEWAQPILLSYQLPGDAESQATRRLHVLGISGTHVSSLVTLRATCKTKVLGPYRTGSWASKRASGLLSCPGGGLVGSNALLSEHTVPGLG